MDARVEFQDECTGVSLACPGLQDLTTNVDFTEFAEAGRLLGGWDLQFYGPIFLLEHASDPWSEVELAHIIERAGGPRTIGLQSFYRYAQGEQWAAFKALVQYKGPSGSSGSSWRLGPPTPPGAPKGISWPLQSEPQFRKSPSSCWTEDPSKPALAALLIRHSFGDRVANAATAVPEAADEAGSLAPNATRDAELLSIAFLDSLELRGKLAPAVDEQHKEQSQAFRDIHLALLLTDYWLYVIREGEKNAECKSTQDPEEAAARVRSVVEIAEKRRLRDMHGEEMFDRVLGRLAETTFSSSKQPVTHAEPFVCFAEQLFLSVCS
eukprot:TRINITY_DN6759_c0_g1_i1.p1 TRINITY_DN6759_c0_g1~~TRINITY_DN6759_c0_g1_i1.p1  ORF type:complete len:339 (+),score=61.99 TRINITY_DN6759_c0_g1_i1:49-1017(+)